jgi:transposase
MIGAFGQVRVFAYAAPCDMRKSYEGLHAIVRNELERNIIDGELFVFTNRRRNRCKVLVFDGTGLCIFMKRLEKGKFAALWRQTEARTLELTMSELQLFIEGSEAVCRLPLTPEKLRHSSLEIGR